ncbi:uncharacterized protein [Apostichopus japonicus]|uniref:uncharacterized protein isoform X14 n=1 Tax=Stichopus japonicus TaxID=307972 RepID=UPI003AB2DAE3
MLSLTLTMSRRSSQGESEAPRRSSRLSSKPRKDLSEIPTRATVEKEKMSPSSSRPRRSKPSPQKPKTTPPKKAQPKKTTPRSRSSSRKRKAEEPADDEPDTKTTKEDEEEEEDVPEVMEEEQDETAPEEDEEEKGAEEVGPSGDTEDKVDAPEPPQDQEKTSAKEDEEEAEEKPATEPAPAEQEEETEDTKAESKEPKAAEEDEAEPVEAKEVDKQEVKEPKNQTVQETKSGEGTPQAPQQAAPEVPKEVVTPPAEPEVKEPSEPQSIITQDKAAPETSSLPAPLEQVPITQAPSVNEPLSSVTTPDPQTNTSNASATPSTPVVTDELLPQSLPSPPASFRTPLRTEYTEDTSLYYTPPQHMDIKGKPNQVLQANKDPVSAQVTSQALTDPSTQKISPTNGTTGEVNANSTKVVAPRAGDHSINSGDPTMHRPQDGVDGHQQDQASSQISVSQV